MVQIKPKICLKYVQVLSVNFLNFETKTIESYKATYLLDRMLTAVLYHL